MEIRTHDNYEANPAGDVDVEFDEELEAPPDDDILSPDERALLTTSIAALIDDDRLPEQYHTKLRDMHQTALLAEEEVSILKDARARNHEELKSKKKEIKKLQLKVDDLKRKLIGRSHNQRVRSSLSRNELKYLTTLADLACQTGKNHSKPKSRQFSVCGIVPNHLPGREYVNVEPYCPS